MNKVIWILTLLFIATALIIGFDVFRQHFEQHTLNIFAQFTGTVMACIITLIMPYKALRIIWSLILFLIAYQLLEDSLQMKEPTYADYILPLLAAVCGIVALYEAFVKKDNQL